MAELVLEARDIVGESIIWDEARKRLAWVDIIGRRIHILEPGTGRHRSHTTSWRPTSIGLVDDGRAIVASQKQVFLWNWDDVFEPICTVEPDLPDNRLNEGVVGPDGAYWVGTMQNNIGPNDGPLDMAEPAGRLYRITADGQCHVLGEDRYGITNTLVWPDADTLITADTLENALYRYRVDADGKLSDRTIFHSGFERGLPDGSAIDVEGYIWNARVAGGGCLIRLSPQGSIDRVIDLPCSWPTSCTFGGEGLGTLFVTSARFTMEAEYVARHPQEGGLFSLDVGVAGRTENRFAL